MRRTIIIAGFAALALLAAGCGDEDKPDKQVAKKPSVYFGWVLGTKEPTGVAIQADPAPGGTTSIKAYVCDGLGPPMGKAWWFKGDVDPKVANEVGRGVAIESANKRQTLDIDELNPRLVKGSVVGATGKRSQFVAYPARDGAGIYEVTLDKALRYAGTSTDGSKLTAQADRAGLVTGDLKPAEGGKLPFAIRTLALASPAELSERGLSTSYRKDVKRSLVPGEYVAVIAPGGTHWLGRAGNVRAGNPAGEIIGLDKKEFTQLSRTQLADRQVGSINPAQVKAP